MFSPNSNSHPLPYRGEPAGYPKRGDAQRREGVVEKGQRIKRLLKPEGSKSYKCEWKNISKSAQKDRLGLISRTEEGQRMKCFYSDVRAMTSMNVPRPVLFSFSISCTLS